jgi:hypothetical protein
LVPSTLLVAYEAGVPFARLQTSHRRILPSTMSWFSILPASISFIETWAIRIFVSRLQNPNSVTLPNKIFKVVLGALTIGPWLLFIVYDVILYIFRAATYDIPYIGGRARNRPRPRAPSLTERPSGRTRTFPLAVPGGSTQVESGEGAAAELKRRPEGPSDELSKSYIMVDD